MLSSKELKNDQLTYAASQGGFLALHESDDTYNGYNRSILTAYAKEHDDVYLGSFNHYGDERKNIVADTLSVYKKYEGCVYNSSCDFCVPVKDELLEQYIRTWNITAQAETLSKAQSRIEELGGILFIWT